MTRRNRTETSILGSPIIQGLWIGSRLSTMERLSIKSFLAHGHRYHLYTYTDIEGVPPGATVMDADEIVPVNRIFRYPNAGSYAGFSDIFRYKLLLLRGNWWADMDTVCCRPFDFSDSVVISSERAGAGCWYANVGVLKFPPSSPVMEAACRISGAKDPESLTHGEIGPALMEWLVARFSLESYVKAPEIFCPISCSRRALLTSPGGEIPREAFTVHLWNEMWAADALNRDGQFPSDSIYEQLKRAYL